MRLYKVENWVYELSNSLLPARDPEPAEKIPPETPIAALISKEMVDWLQKLGFTRDQSVALYNGLFTHYWYTVGIRDVRLVQIRIRDYIAARVAPAVYQARGIAPQGLPPVVIFAAAVILITAVVVLMVAPTWDEFYKWYPTCDSYIATFEESLWWFTLVSRDDAGRLWYRAVGSAGGVITAHTYEPIAPPVLTDRFHFWGTMEFRCWQIPWFRVYRAQHVDTTFVGFLEHAHGDFYILRPQFDDPFAPLGYFEISPSQYCMEYSPCSV